MRQGFTIIEVTITVAIIGIVAVITLPLLQNYQPTLKLNSVSRDFAINLRYAQQRAVTEQVSYYVSLDVAARTYQIIKKDDHTIIKTVTIPDDLTWQVVSPGFTNNKIEFVLTGAVVESGKILISNNRNKIVSLEIKPSGYVKLAREN